MTQDHVCAKTHVPKSSLSAFENGKQSLPEEHLLALAKFYKVAPDVLIQEIETPEVLKDAPAVKGPTMSPRGDFEAALKWIVLRWDDATLRDHITEAVAAGRNPVARVLLDIDDERRAKAADGPAKPDLVAGSVHAALAESVATVKASKSEVHR